MQCSQASSFQMCYFWLPFGWLLAESVASHSTTPPQKARTRTAVWVLASAGLYVPTASLGTYFLYASSSASHLSHP